MTPEVEQAIAELRAAFPTFRIEVDPEEQGGAHVTLSDVPLGSIYRPATAWIGFVITFQYPEADIYPLFTNSGLARTDGREIGPAFQQRQWRGRPATQISRRSNHWNPNRDTAAMKVAKVLKWMAEQ